MIKCPECGREISENAPFCPNCGIKIARNIKRCPECGTIALMTSELCPHCGYPYKPEDNEAAQNGKAAFDANTVYDPNAEAGQVSHNRKKRTWMIVILCVIAIAAGILAYVMIASQKKQNAEDSAYQLLTNDINVKDYEEFLAAYPDSKYKSDVESRLNALKTQNEQWMNISLSGSKNDFIQFMSQFPSSPYEQQCKIKIDSLDWLDAKRLNTPDAIQRYLSEHPDGKYVADAEDMQSAIIDKTVEPQEEEMIRTTIVQFFTALAANNQTGVCSNISPVMTSFLQKTDAKKADVISVMDQMHPESITAMQFVVNNDLVITKTKTANGFTYTVQFSVDQNIARTDEGKTFASYTVEANFTPQFKISALKMTEISNR